MPEYGLSLPAGFFRHIANASPGLCLLFTVVPTPLHGGIASACTTVAFYFILNNNIFFG
jgi:hypothetical protein